MTNLDASPDQQPGIGEDSPVVTNRTRRPPVARLLRAGARGTPARTAGGASDKNGVARTMGEARRWVAAGCVVVAASVVAVYSLVAGDIGGQHVTATFRRAGYPVTNVAALGPGSTLAFVSDGQLWVLDGPAQSLRPVSHSSGATDPQFSPDGKWLAFATSGGVWIARADGATVGEVTGSAGSQDLSWAPAGDLLAGAGRGIVGVTPGGVIHQVTARGGDGVWSPAGSEIAFAVVKRHAVWLEEIPAQGGTTTVWYRSPFAPAVRAAKLAATPNKITVAAVLPGGKGLLFWFDYRSANPASAQPLYLIRAPKQSPIQLGVTLPEPDAVAVSPSGQFAIVAGDSPYAWQDKTLKLCSALTAVCSTVLAPQSDVTIDPAWSPNGQSLTFVEAPASGAHPVSQRGLAAWYASHTLWTVGTTGLEAEEVPGTAGATAPVWSASGASLLYEAADGIWLLPTISGTPVRIATPLFPPGGGWPAAFGRVAWAQQFGWSAASTAQ